MIASFASFQMTQQFSTSPIWFIAMIYIYFFLRVKSMINDIYIKPVLCSKLFCEGWEAYGFYAEIGLLE